MSSDNWEDDIQRASKPTDKTVTLDAARSFISGIEAGVMENKLV